MAGAEQAIQNARDKLQTARFGLTDMSTSPERFYSGLANAVVFGRMVTLALQNMTGHVDGFSEWYGPVQCKLAADPLMQAFKRLRNEIEKQATQPTTMTFSMGSFNIDFFESLPKPPHAISFIASHAGYGGASGWRLRSPEGEEGFYPVELPAGMVNTVMSFRDFPADYADTDVASLIERYLNTLAAIIEDAAKHFLGAGARRPR